MLLTLARPPVRERRLRRQTGERAFTLIELLTVIGIIAILSAITFGVVKGVQERAAIGQAKTELAVLAQALEAYKSQYGDYPQTGGIAAVAVTATAKATTTANSQGYFFNALMGKLGPTLAIIDGKQFIEASKFSLQATTMPTTGTTAASLADNGLLDPWGRLYLYYYKAVGAAKWTNPSYVLLSTGPDGVSGITVDTSAANGTGAIVISIASKEADNIYANK